MTKTISGRQLALIAFISTFALRLTTLPALLFEEAQIDAIFIVLSIVLLDFIEFFLIIYILRRNQDVSFAQFLERRFGKFVSKIILAIFYVFFFFKFLLIMVGGYEYARFAIFKEASLFLFGFIIISISFSFVFFKTKSFARTVEFFFPIIAWILIGFLITALLTANFNDIRPFFNVSSQKLFSTYFHYGITTGSYLFMLLFMGKIKFGEKDSKQFLFYIILANLILVAFYLMDYSIFRNTAMAHPHAISEIIQFIPVPSLLGNFSWIAVSAMLLLYCFHAGTFAICLSVCANGIFQKQNNFRKCVFKSCVFGTITLICLLVWQYFSTFQAIKMFAIDGIVFPIIFSVAIGFSYLFFIIEAVVGSINKKKGVKK